MLLCKFIEHLVKFHIDFDGLSSLAVSAGVKLIFESLVETRTDADVLLGLNCLLVGLLAF